MPASLNQIAADTDLLLNHKNIGDYAGALNGLQLANNGRVTRLAAAVDANLPVVQHAIVSGADLLVAHHGIAWSPLLPLTGRRYELLKLCLDHNLAIYSSHLPLDLHARLGNNVLLAKALGFTVSAPFFLEKGACIGRCVKARVTRDELRKRLNQALDADSQLIAAGPALCRVIGIVSGGAGNELARAAADGVDTFITGEGAHWTFSLAHELGVNVFYGGHYRTETFGVKALAAHLSKKYRLPWRFIDMPSGL
ncbi:MAG: Nif3-like dinuclear metal center hexameric protein [Verrucomicrobiales bacterium]|jgi:dinuclear metal center YbgI/SA1388 family protein|nr:Nif3-like dinuclear metal center hexameric protein [Verrucomicrobiales bacterium]